MIQFKPIDAEGIRDRAYRIYYNEGQNRTDRFTQVASCWPTHFCGLRRQSHSCALAIQYTPERIPQNIRRRCS
jgi:hypothetical protein